MPQTKRPYTPKTKGCHECSQRRVDCDKTLPACSKCTTRGLRCSGYGVRYRFKTDACGDEEFGAHFQDPAPNWSQRRAGAEHWVSADLVLSTQKPWKRYLLNYFSQRIAAEMVLVDDHRNGWRYLILPLAQQDDLVENAVLSVAAFHYTMNVNNQFLEPHTVYQRAIRNLRSRQNLTSYDMMKNQSVLLSLLVLLVAAVVSGSSDFRTIFNLLEACLQALGGEDCISHGELGTFIVWQIRKYRGWLAPLLGPETGVERLNQSLTKPYTCEGWEDISYNTQLYPHFEDSWSLIYNLCEQACNLYVLRAQANPGSPSRTDLVSKFIQTLERLPADSPGMYTIPWDIFLAALEASEPAQQQYLEQALLRHHQRNGFANIPLALTFLRQSRAELRSKNWTAALVEVPVFVV